MNDVCSLELLTNAVANRLSADEETALYDHLERCEACCARMEQLAGGEQWQQEAAALLTTDELDAAVPELMVWSEVDFSVEHLEPSEDAKVLGQLGGYDVLAIIGRGGMGVVLKAFDRELKRFVAIKALSPHLAHSSVARKRFARKAQAAAAVVNPHVIAIHHVQPTGRLPFLIMPLLTGESLAQRLKSRAPLELTEVLRIGMQAAVGLAAAHDQGLVHRDVKPANIFLEKGVERVVITDFGLARASDDVSMTRLGVVAGTPEYMSPEQARGEALDCRSDLFSLGCVLYEMATGVSPFRSDSTIATLRRIVDDKPTAMASLAPELPPWFSYIVERLLSKDPAQRFASASEVALLLEHCLSHLQQPASVPLPASLLSQASGHRLILPAIRKRAIAMLGTFATGLMGMVLWQATEAPDISGQWTSDEWGTVILDDKRLGRYEGTFNGSDKEKPAYEITEISGYSNEGLRNSAVLTETKSGKIQLKWSRVERRFNGTWSKGLTRSGKISLRLVEKEIRGAWTTAKEAQRESDGPRLGDLTWKRSVVTVPDGGTVLLGGPKLTSETVKPLDRQNARAVVEAYIALALAGDVAKAAALAKNSPADPKHIRELPEFLNVQRLKIETVYVNDPAKPTRALATSAAVKLDEDHKQPIGQSDGFMVFRLELTDDKWFVIDIDFESESGAEKELERFLEANPNSIGLSPLTSGSMPNLNPAANHADDLDRLQGAWQSLDSKKLPVMPGGRNQFSVSFLTDRMSMSGPQRAGIGTFSLSPDTVPKQIDCRLATGDKHTALKGIYEFRDSQLWLCLTEGEQRPMSFDNPPTVAGLMTFALERKQLELPNADSIASLALSDWSQSQNGAGVFATYTLSIPGIETISQGLAAGGPAVKEFSEVPGFPEKVFTLRYFLPNLSPRGMAFVAGTSFQSSLDLIELAQLAEHKRLVKVFSYPDSATEASDPIGAVPVNRPVETPVVEPMESSLKISILTAGANQADWLKEIDATGEIIYGYEVVVQNANISAPPAGDAATAAPAESPLLVEARKALQVCQESLTWKQKFDMRVTNSYVNTEVGKVTIESRVRRDAPRMVESSLQTFDDQPKDHIRLDNWRLDDGEMFISRTTTVGQKKLTGLMTIKGRQKASWRMFESSSSFAMEGHFPGNQGRTLMELLMESKEPDVRMEKLGDHDCLRISDSNDWGTMTVWIDAGPSRRLRQCESFKERGNRFADGRVGEDKDTANLESFSYFVENIQYKVIDGIEIAISCRLRSTSIPNGGAKQEASTEYRRTEIHLRPDFGTNNPFVGDFDNGARINDGDAFDRDAAFRWQDGKLTVLSGQASGSGLDP